MRLFMVLMVVLLFIPVSFAACVNFVGQGKHMCATMSVNPDGTLVHELPNFSPAAADDGSLVSKFSRDELLLFEDMFVDDIEYGKVCVISPGLISGIKYSCNLPSEIGPDTTETVYRCAQAGSSGTGIMSWIYSVELGSSGYKISPATVVAWWGALTSGRSVSVAGNIFIPYTSGAPWLAGDCVGNVYGSCDSTDTDGDGLGFDCPDSGSFIDSGRSCFEGVPSCYLISENNELCELSPRGIPKCADFCVDEDDDLVCSSGSARLKSSDYSAGSYPEWYASQALDFYNRILNPGRENPFARFIIGKPQSIDLSTARSWLDDGFLLLAFDQDDHDPNVGFFSDEVCNYKDDNGDGLIDNCGGKAPPITGPFIGECTDGIDNDEGENDEIKDPAAVKLGKPLIDAEDPACAAGFAFERMNPQCSDGIDNDGDGEADWPDDPGCRNLYSNDESPACDDGLDNDLDGLMDYFTDLPDPSCQYPWSTSEVTQCSNGIDDDGDGLVDSVGLAGVIHDIIVEGLTKYYFVKGRVTITLLNDHALEVRSDTYNNGLYGPLDEYDTGGAFYQTLDEWYLSGRGDTHLELIDDREIGGAKLYEFRLYLRNPNPDDSCAKDYQMTEMTECSDNIDNDDDNLIDGVFSIPILSGDVSVNSYSLHNTDFGIVRISLEYRNTFGMQVAPPSPMIFDIGESDTGQSGYWLELSSPAALGPSFERWLGYSLERKSLILGSATVSISPSDRGADYSIKYLNPERGHTDPYCIYNGSYNPSIDSETGTSCSDGIDNDGDGGFDIGGNFSCFTSLDIAQECLALGITDFDTGSIELPADEDCDSINDISESPDERDATTEGENACSDGIDNDGDGLVDWNGITNPKYRDPKCTSETDQSERIAGFQFESMLEFNLNLLGNIQTLWGPFTPPAEPEGEQHCVMDSGDFVCRVVDSDSDTYWNASYDCPNCLDCDDDDNTTNPSVFDTSSGDKNCNGPSEDHVDDDSDGIFNMFDNCVDEGSSAITDIFGCWISPIHYLLPGWSE